MSSRISKLAEAVKNDPDNSFSKFALALELLKTEQIKQARFLFEHIVINDPDYVGVYYHLGKLYQEIDENKLALQTYKAGVTIAEKLRNDHAKKELMAALAELELEYDQ